MVFDRLVLVLALALVFARARALERLGEAGASSESEAVSFLVVLRVRLAVVARFVLVGAASCSSGAA